MHVSVVRSAVTRLDHIEWSTVDERIEEMLDEGARALIDAGIKEHQISYQFAVDMRYLGQQNEVTIPLENDPRKTRDVGDLMRRFEAGYENLYGVRLDGIGAEIVNLRVTATSTDAGRTAVHELSEEPTEPKSAREVFFGKNWLSVPVFDRQSIGVGQEILGPVLIEERETTVFVLPNWSIAKHDDGSLIADRKQ